MAVESSGNGLKDDFDAVLNTFTNAGEKVAGIYSTFLGAKTAYTVAQAQKVDAQNASSYAPEQEDILSLGGVDVSYKQLIIFGAIALAIIGTGAVIYKSVKK